MDRIMQDAERLRIAIARISAEKREATPLEVALAEQTERSAAAHEALRERLNVAIDGQVTANMEIDRLRRCLRVLRASVLRQRPDVLDQIERALEGERL